MEFSITDNLGRTIEIKGTILDNPSEDVAYTYYNVVQMIDWRLHRRLRKGGRCHAEQTPARLLHVVGFHARRRRHQPHDRPGVQRHAHQPARVLPRRLLRPDAVSARVDQAQRGVGSLERRSNRYIHKFSSVPRR